MKYHNTKQGATSGKIFVIILALNFACSISIWAQTFEFARQAGGKALTRGSGIAVDDLGNSHVTGEFWESADFDGHPLSNNGAMAPFVAKYDPSGTVLWALSIETSQNNRGQDIALDNSGNTYVTGDFGGPSDFDPSGNVANLTSFGGCTLNVCSPDVFLAKYDNNGNYVWAIQLGGDLNDDGYAVTYADSHVYVTGSFAGTADFDPGTGSFNLVSNGSLDGFFAKYDLAGNLVWAKSVGSSSIDEGLGIAADGSGNVYVTGSFSGTVDFDPGVGVADRTSQGSLDIFLAKYDDLGNFVWVLTFGGTEGDAGSDIAFDAAGNIYLTGIFRGIVNFNPRLGADNLISNGEADAFLASYDPQGEFRWVISWGGTKHEEVNALALDSSGNINVTGGFQDVVDFDPGPDIFELTGTSESLFLARFEESGSFLGALGLGGDESGAEGQDIGVDWADNIYVTGGFGGTLDFDPGPGTFNLASDEQSDAFLWKLAPNSPPVCSLVHPGLLECQGTATSVQLDGSGSSDPDQGDILTFSWQTDCPGGSFNSGSSSVPVLTVDSRSLCPLACTATLTVTDQQGLSDTCDTTITIEDTIPPEITCPADLTVECAGDIPLPNPALVSAEDICDPEVTVAFVGDTDNGGAGCGFDPLIITRTYRAMDECHNISECTQTITVQDTLPPAVMSSVSREDLWPPIHTLVDVGLEGQAIDNCTANSLVGVEVYSDEDDNELTGSGHHAPDAANIGLGSLALRAERKGNSDGRVNLIVVTAIDECGNSASTCNTVTVAKSTSVEDQNNVRAQAAAAGAYCEANGSPPQNFVLIGE